MILESVVHQVAAHGYGLVFLTIFLECAGLPIPGELMLLAFGAIAAQGHFDPALGILIATVAALGGDVVAYWIGRLTGDRLLGKLRIGRRWTIGPRTILFGRFLIGARMMVAPLAGARRMPFHRYVAVDALGALLGTLPFVAIGYSAGTNVATLQQHWSAVTTVLQGVVVLAVLAYAARYLSRLVPLSVVACALLLTIIVLRPAIARAGDHPGAIALERLSDAVPAVRIGAP